MLETDHKGVNSGQGMNEYLMILGGVVVILALSLQVLGGNISNIFGAQISPALAIAMGGQAALEADSANESGNEQPSFFPDIGVSLPSLDGLLPSAPTPAPAPVTINPVTGEIMPDTGGSSSNSNATSGMGQEQVSKTSTGTFQLANTLTQMALSGRYDNKTSNDMLFLVDTLYSMGAVEAFLDDHPKFEPFIKKYKYNSTDAVNELEALDNRTQSILNSLAQNDQMSLLDKTSISALIKKTSAIADNYVAEHTSDDVLATNNKITKLVPIQTIKEEAAEVLEEGNATAAVLITLDSAQILENNSDSP